MPNPYLYATVALVVVLAAVGVWLGLANIHLQSLVNSLESKYSSLEGEYSLLAGNYSGLKTHYASLSLNYSRLEGMYKLLEGEYSSLEANYSRLKITYTTLSENYTMLSNAFNALKANYTTLNNEYGILNAKFMELNENYTKLQANYSSLINALGVNVVVKPILYYAPRLNGVYGYALYVNVTNLSNETVFVIGMGNEYYGGAYYWYKWIPIPPNSTVAIPLAQGLDTSERPSFRMGTVSNVLYPVPTLVPPVDFMFYPNNTSPMNIMGTNVTVYMMFSNGLLSGLGIKYVVRRISAVVSTTVTLSQTAIASALYLPGSSSFELGIAYYNSTGAGIYGYSIYSENGTLLATCRLSEPLILYSISIGVFGSLPTSSGPFTTDSYELSIGFGFILNISVLHDDASCTPPKFTFPEGFNGYVILETNVSNIMAPLVLISWPR